jgi:hypothetical protein
MTSPDPDGMLNSSSSAIVAGISTKFRETEKIVSDLKSGPEA